MIIDIRLKDAEGIRYNSDFIPQVGETVTSIVSKFTYKIVAVDHLIVMESVCNKDPYEQLVTCDAVEPVA